MYEVGDIVKDFTLESTEGSYTLSERVRDNYALLYFYVVNFGKTCTDYIALMNERSSDFKRRNVELVHINPESVENHRDWIRSTSSLFEHLSDRDQAVSRDFDCIISGTDNDRINGKTNRALFLIDGDMRVRYCWRAAVPHDTVPMDTLLEAIDEALS
ncbi:MAG: peroxiredoxin family protein [Candidatus Methanomethylophilaceae archaeon]